MSRARRCSGRAAVVAAWVIGITAVIAVTTMAGCGRGTDVLPAGHDESGGLEPVALPDLSRLSGPAQERVRVQHESVDRLRETGAPLSELALAYGALGLSFMALEDSDRAGACYRNAQRLQPRDMRWPYYLAHLHRMNEERARAVELFERVLDLSPSNLPTLIWLGRSYLDQGRFDDAERVLDRALVLDPRSSAALAGIGQALAEQGEHERAIEYLEDALMADPRASSLRYPLAMAYRAVGNLEAANEQLRQLGGGTPSFRDPLMEAFDGALPSSMAFERRGIEALGEGRWEAAVDLFRQGLEIEPENVSIRQRLATALAMGGDTRGAIDELERVLDEAPDFARAHFSLAAILTLGGRHEEAARRYRVALEHAPDSVEARMGLAEALRAAGRLEESLPEYGEVVRLDPGFAEAWIGRADALVRLERYAEAHEWLTEARRVHPDRPELVRLDEVVVAVMGTSAAVGR